MQNEINPWYGRARRIEKRGPFCRGLAVDENGATLGPDYPLVFKTSRGYQSATSAEICFLLELLFDGRGDPIRICDHLASIAKALEAGELAKARILGLHFSIHDLTRAQLGLLNKLSRLVKYDPNEPRDWGGRWTTGDGELAGEQLASNNLSGGSSGAPPGGSTQSPNRPLHLSPHSTVEIGNIIFNESRGLDNEKHPARGTPDILEARKAIAHALRNGELAKRPPSHATADVSDIAEKERTVYIACQWAAIEGDHQGSVDPTHGANQYTMTHGADPFLSHVVGGKWKRYRRRNVVYLGSYGPYFNSNELRDDKGRLVLHSGNGIYVNFYRDFDL